MNAPPPKEPNGSSDRRPPAWVRLDEELRDLLAAVGRGPLAIDFEADSFHRYFEKICLVQVSFAGRDALIDPLADVDLRGLGPVLEDPEVPKFVHGADYDLRLLDRGPGLRVRGLFDTMIAARLTGERRFGLAALLEAHLDVRLDKTHQRADWAVRPLSEAMVAYAVDDTRHLDRLVARLRGRLRELGREAWAEEEFRRLEQVRWTAGDGPAPDAFRKLKGARDLDGRALAVLRELFELRDGRARERDVPAFRVARDEVLVAIARSGTADPGALRSVRGLPKPWRDGRRLEALLAAVRRGLEGPEESRRVRARGPRLPDPPADALARLKAARDRAAERHGLEPSLVGSRRVLESAARRVGEGGRWDEDDELRDWQREILEPELDGA